MDYQLEALLYPERLQLNLLITAAIENLDHNSSSVTAKALFTAQPYPSFKEPLYAGRFIPD